MIDCDFLHRHALTAGLFGGINFEKNGETIITV